MKIPPSANPAPANPVPGMTLWRGSPRDALRTYLSPLNEKRGPLWAHLVVLFGFNTAMAVLLTLGALPGSMAAASEVFWRVFPFTQTIGISIMGLHTFGQSLLGEQRVRAWPPLLHLLYRACLACLGTYIGFTLALSFRAKSLQAGMAPFADDGLPASIGIGLVVTFVVYRVVSVQARNAQAQAEVERERARSAAAEAREAAARLQLLQAQIEPHFLFNTLANVLGLIGPRPDDARKMLEDFIFYLRASLDVTRESSTTLGRELDLLERYLSIFQFRMGRRLLFTIDCPPSLRSIPIAPMLLQPLVENSIEHGLEPKVQGGSVVITVQPIDDEIVIEIADSGLGFLPGSEGGVGLANVRERLQLLYGDRARLSIEERQPEGTRARVILPVTDPVDGADPGGARDPSVARSGASATQTPSAGAIRPQPAPMPGIAVESSGANRSRADVAGPYVS